jgi:N-acetylneuraminic acid mutarotase
MFGGEEPEFHARREVYMFDLHAYQKSKCNRLVSKAKMPTKKFDFTLAEMNGWIYIISGKNGTGKVVPSCHRYNPTTDTYHHIADVKYPRYAASAASIWPNLYIFGGRGGEDNNMISHIEVYEYST